MAKGKVISTKGASHMMPHPPGGKMNTSPLPRGKGGGNAGGFAKSPRSLTTDKVKNAKPV